LHNEFVESQALAACLGDAGACRLGETKGGDRDLREIEDALIVSDGADANSDSFLVGSEVLDELGKGERRPVGSGGNESSEDGLGESGVGSAGQESEQLHRKY
jgi:hypothetical protein